MDKSCEEQDAILRFVGIAREARYTFAEAHRKGDSAEDGRDDAALFRKNCSRQANVVAGNMGDGAGSSDAPQESGFRPPT